MSNKVSVTDDPTYKRVEPITEGDEIAWVVPVGGVVTGISSPTMKMFKRGSTTDLSSTYFTGSMSVSGTDTVVTKTTSNIKAGDYVIPLKATIDGQTYTFAKLLVLVKREGDV